MRIFALLAVSLISTAAFAQAKPDEGSLLNFRPAGKAADWTSARKACTDIGQGWDLPTLEDYMNLGPNNLNSVDLGQMGKQFPAWVLADSEENNQKIFAGKSLLVFGVAQNNQVSFKMFDISAAVQKRISDEIEEMKAAPMRTDAENQKLQDFFGDWQKKNPGQQLDLSVPHPEFGDEINGILRKIPAGAVEQVKAQIAASEAFLAAIQDGYGVICVQHEAKK